MKPVRSFHVDSYENVLVTCQCMDYNQKSLFQGENMARIFDVIEYPNEMRDEIVHLSLIHI